jgi:membrane protease YdiL (CAAX protease family)
MNSKNSNFLRATSDTEKYVNPKLGFIFIAIILLESYLSPFIYSIVGVDNATSWYIGSIIAYSVIVLSLIIFTLNRLELFNDHFSLWTIVLGCFLSAMGGENAVLYKGILIILSTVLSIYIIANRKSIKFPSSRSFFTGLLWSVGAVIIIGLVYAFLDQTYTKPFPSNLLAIIVSVFVSQLSFVTVIEEAYFRGLLFGFMVINGYKENTALFIQAVLFWGIHFLDSSNPTLFFVIIPLGTLFMTLIIKKYRMLYLSITMHTLLNVFTTLLVTAINRYLF